jgi:hypothetical protein
LAETLEPPEKVKVQVFAFWPPLEQAPDQMASRLPDTLRVIEAPTVNDAEPLLPLATLMPAGFDTTVCPLRPLADTVSVAVCAGGGGGAAGVTVTVAVRVTPAYVAEMVAVVVVVTLVVVTVKPRAVVPVATVAPAGTLTRPGLLLERDTVVSASAVPDSITNAEVGEPPSTLDGLAVTLCRVTLEAPAGVTVSVPVRLDPLYVAVMTTLVEAATADVEMTKEPVNELAGTVAVAGTLATPGLLLDSEMAASPAGPADITIVPLELFPPTTVVGLMSTFDSAAGGGGAWAVKLRTADQAPTAPAELTPRTRQKCVAAARPVAA